MGDTQYKKLYLANNFESLQCIAKADVDYKTIRNFRKLRQMLDSLYEEIQKDTNDQEKTFVYIFRFLEINRYVTSLVNDEVFLEKIIGRALHDVEILSSSVQNSLIRRYNQESLPMTSAASSPTDISEKKLFRDKFIDSQELYSALQKKENLLLVDIRPFKDFKDSQIKAPTVLNIPAPLITPGLSPHALGNFLTKQSRALWDKRDTFRVIVVIDWESTPTTISPTLSRMHSMLTEWDYNKNYSEPAVMLCGGYLDWIHRFPTQSTNPHVMYTKASASADFDDLLSLDSISYPEEKKKPEVKPPVPPKIPDLPVVELGGFSMPSTSKTDDYLPEPYPIQLPESNEELYSALGEYEEKLKLATESGGSDTLATTSAILKSKKLDQPKLYPVIDKVIDYPKPLPQSVKRTLEVDRKSKPSTESILPPNHFNRETKPKVLRNSLGLLVDASPFEPHAGLVGLKNIRNTCYMNTIIQCFRHLPIIKGLFCSGDYAKLLTARPDALYLETAKLVRHMFSTSERCFTPNSFYNKFCSLNQNYKQGNHEDCMEFFLIFLNHLIEDTKSEMERKTSMSPLQTVWYNYMQGKTSIFIDYFYHQIRIHQSCDVCKNSNSKYEVESTLILPVPTRDFDLVSLVDDYLAEFTIEDYHCSTCKRPMKNRKKMCYFPPVLVLHLKRYKQSVDHGNMVFVKNDSLAHFPVDNLIIDGQRYELHCVALHEGTINFGHYKSVIRVSNSWYEFNDERVRPIDVQCNEVKRKACAFFYCLAEKR